MRIKLLSGYRALWYGHDIMIKFSLWITSCSGTYNWNAIRIGVAVIHYALVQRTLKAAQRIVEVHACLMHIVYYVVITYINR